MCGIAFAYNKEGNEVKDIIKGIYNAQRNRGTDGFGFVEILEDELKHHTFVTEQGMLDVLDKSKSNHILFHHRVPTSSSNNVASNHPICLNDDLYKHNYYFIHNGHIGNADELRKDHETRGLKYNTDDGSQFTDSEALAHELALIIEEVKEPKDFEAKGSIVFIMIQTDKNNNPIALYYGRNYSNQALKMFQTSDSLTLRSESATGEMVDANILHRYDYATKEITKKAVNFGVSIWMPSRVAEIKPNALTDAIIKLYEHRSILFFDVESMEDNELNMLLVIARKVASINLMTLEENLLTSSSNGLALLRSNYESAMKSIYNIELKLK